ncbi:MAG: hypothetical protein AAF641_03755 [Pseudomonadota bacterium]
MKTRKVSRYAPAMLASGVFSGMLDHAWAEDRVEDDVLLHAVFDTVKITTK